MTQSLSPAPVAQPVEEFVDFFDFAEQKTYVLPDGKQQIFFEVMNEGAKTRYQQKVNRDIHVNQQTRDARIKTDPAGERKALIEESVTGWNLVRKNKSTGAFEQVTFSKGSAGSTFSQWLNGANPAIVEELEDAIRKANPWMQADMSVEDIDKEIERLQDLKVQVQEQEARQQSFS